MSGLQKDGTFELTPTMAHFYLRRKDIPKEFYKLEFWDFLIKVFEWKGVKAEKKARKVKYIKDGKELWKTSFPCLIVHAGRGKIWEVLSGLPSRPGADKY